MAETSAQAERKSIDAIRAELSLVAQDASDVDVTKNVLSAIVKYLGENDVTETDSATGRAFRWTLNRVLVDNEESKA